MRTSADHCGLVIRPTIADDFADIADLTNIYIRDTAIHFGYEPVTPSELREYWEHDRATYPWLTAELDGRFAGYVKASVWRTRAAYSKTIETGIYVVPELQGKGIGKALYLRLFDELRTRGFHVAVAGITLPNDASVKLHEAVGFAFVGRFAEVGRKFDVWHDVGFWQLTL